MLKDKVVKLMEMVGEFDVLEVLDYLIPKATLGLLILFVVGAALGLTAITFENALVIGFNAVVLLLLELTRY